MLLHRFVLPAALTTAALLIPTSCGENTYPVRTYTLGEKVQLGALIYNVFETQWLTQIGTGESARIPQNRFFLVRVSITNSGTSRVVAPNLTIEGLSGGSFPELSDGDGVPQWIGYLRQIDPADSTQGNVVFDAPPKEYRLRISDEDGRRAALIDIPLSFGAETTDVPTPGMPGEKIK